MNVLLSEQEALISKYPHLHANTTQLTVYTKAAEMLCHITNKPRPIWSYWAAFDFCVTIITTVGKRIVHGGNVYKSHILNTFNCRNFNFSLICDKNVRCKVL